MAIAAVYVPWITLGGSLMSEPLFVPPRPQHQRQRGEHQQSIDTIHARRAPAVRISSTLRT